MIKLVSVCNENTFTKLSYKRMKTATVCPYTQHYKHFNNGRLFYKQTYFEIIFYKLCSSNFLHNHNSLWYNLPTFNVSCNAVSMFNCALNLAISVLYITLKYFIYRSNMSDYFQNQSEPMDIEGEAVCAVGPQLVTAGGEQGAGVKVNMSFSEKGGGYPPAL